MDASWHLANLLMGEWQKDNIFFQQQLQQHIHHSQRTAAGAVTGREEHVAIDIASAVQLYTQSASLGHTLSLHRLSHMMSAGIGVQKSCPSAVNGFKQVCCVTIELIDCLMYSDIFICLLTCSTFIISVILINICNVM